MKRKLKLLVTMVLGITLMLGINSCGKESSGGIEPTPVNPTPNNDKPKPEPEKPKPENPDVQQLYEDAFKIISESHDYKKAVENLKQAAEANVDSANLTLAYMYEYGIGVDQDIEKAKDFYAKEASAHNNEFAADKLASLSNGKNNCVVQLPEDCNIRANEVLIDCGDTITFANGDGSFNTSAVMVKTRDFDGEYVNICYRHPDSKEKTELNSMETAVTLMLCNVPYGFNLSESAYQNVREQLLTLDETKQLAEEIDKQVKANGHFDMVSVAPIVAQGRKTIYETYGGDKFPHSKRAIQGIVDGLGWVLRDDEYEHQCFIGQGNMQNDVTTTFKSGYYDSDNKVWNTVIHIKNLSQVCFMAVPGSWDFNKKEFVAKYDNVWERITNGRIVQASKFWDLGGGSFSGLVEAQLNYMALFSEHWDETYAATFGDHPLDDITSTIHAWADAQQLYREKYLSQEEDIEMQIYGSIDALQYMYPYNAWELIPYFLIYYCAVPSFEFMVKVPGKEALDKTQFLKKIKAITDNVAYKILKDPDVSAAVQQCISSGHWADDNAIELYKKIFWKVTEYVWGEVDKTGAAKNITKGVKTAVEVGEKIGDEKYEKAMFKTAKFVEGYATKGNEFAEQFTQVFASAEDLITFFSGIRGMLTGEYRNFVVRFASTTEDMQLMYQPINSVTDGVAAKFTAQTFAGVADMSIYVDDKLLTQAKDVMSISYDLSKLSIGSYNIKVVAKFLMDDGAQCHFVTKTGEFRCNVVPPFNGGLTPVSGDELDANTNGNGFVPNIKGQDLEQYYNSGGTAPGVKGQYLDQTYNSGAKAPEVKGQYL